MLTLLLANLIAGLAAPQLVARARPAAPWLLGAVPLLTAAGLVTSFFLGDSRDLVQSLSWAPSLGVDFALRADGLSLLFVALVGLIGGLVVLHAGSYLATSPQLGRFNLLVLLFITAMFGLVLADNLWLLFVCWELTSITSFFLIGFKNSQEYAREAARRALVTTGAGGLALLAGFVVLTLMGRRAGLSLEEAASISSLLQLGSALTADPLYPVALILILLGAFTKSAQMPFHHWLPAAMAGPTPVSALLHSATMVKAGVFLLARLNPALGGTDLWTLTLVITGTVTMLGGALLAVGRIDLKDILAYSTISALGTLVLLLGLGTQAALAAMIVFLTVHALYKSALFLVVANIDHQTGTRDLKALGGLKKMMPLTAMAAMLAALGKAGAPPALGYMGKKLALQAKLGAPAFDQWLILAAVLTNIAMVALALALAWRPFWSTRSVTVPRDVKLAAGMVFGPLVLAVLGVAVGLVPSLFDENLGAAAASAVAGSEVTFDLKVWSGLNLESMLLTGLSLVVFVAGYALYRKLDFFHRRPTLPGPIANYTPTVLYQKSLDGFLRLAGAIAQGIQTGRLRHYVGAVSLAAALAALPWLIVTMDDFPGSFVNDPGLHEFLLVLLMGSGAVGAAFNRRPIVAVLSAGMTGLGLAMVFALYSGVDLAITQLLVETLMIVILVAVLSRLPDLGPPADTRFRLRDLALSSVLGLTMTLAVLLPIVGDRSSDLARTILDWSWAEAAGRNVVNVILVDFRALDTLGEIVVVAAAALTVAALVAGRKRGLS